MDGIGDSLGELKNENDLQNSLRNPTSERIYGKKSYAAWKNKFLYS